MRKAKYKGRCEKRKIEKCEEVCRLYDSVQSAYADVLASDESVTEIRCNVSLDGLEEGEYISDFVCVRSDGELMVRECVSRKHLAKPMTVRLLDLSREYWRERGVSDWRIVTDAEG